MSLGRCRPTESRASRDSNYAANTIITGFTRSRAAVLATTMVLRSGQHRHASSHDSGQCLVTTRRQQEERPTTAGATSMGRKDVKLCHSAQSRRHREGWRQQSPRLYKWLGSINPYAISCESRRTEVRLTQVQHRERLSTPLATDPDERANATSHRASSPSYRPANGITLAHVHEPQQRLANRNRRKAD